MTYHQPSSIAIRAAEVRRRLMNPPNAYRPPEPEPVVLTLPTPVADEDGVPWGAPLDFLKPCSAHFLIAVASLKTGVPVEEILGRDRQVRVMVGRTLAIQLVYLHTQRSLPSVGALFDRDHTTIINALKKLGKYAKLVDKSPLLVKVDRPKNPDMGLAGRMVAKRNRKIKTLAAHNIIRRSYAAGWSPERIARELGYTPKRVRDIARRIGAVVRSQL